MISLALNKQTIFARVSATTVKAAETSEDAALQDQDVRAARTRRMVLSGADLLLMVPALRSAVDSLFVYITGEAYGIQDVSDTLSDDSDDFQIIMDRPSRFNSAMMQPLKSRFEDYLVSSMLFDWYSSIGSDLAQPQQAKLVTIQQSIARCFRKTDSGVFSSIYPSRIELGTIPEIVVVGCRFTVPYTVSGDSDMIDDCSLRHSDGIRCERHLGELEITALTPGEHSFEIYSLHDDRVSASGSFVGCFMPDVVGVEGVLPKLPSMDIEEEFSGVDISTSTNISINVQ